MEQTEVSLFIILSTIILLLFTGGIIMFIVQYQKRRLIHEKEKTMMNEHYTHELLKTQVEIQEQTMQDIGREIHDNVGQRLTLASIYANQMLADGSQADERMVYIGNIINESLTELRALSKSLVSTDADAAELTAIISRECVRVSALRICEVSYKLADVRFTISTTIKNFIIRIVQESLQNSLKHAECRHIDLQLDINETGLSLMIGDDGIGFDINATSTGIGLQNMKKRAELIGATLSLNSNIGQGTTMSLIIPIQKLFAP